jgi:hypothetical protein
VPPETASEAADSVPLLKTVNEPEDSVAAPVMSSRPSLALSVPPLPRKVPVESVDVLLMLIVPALSVVRPATESVSAAALRASVASAFPTVSAA